MHQTGDTVIGASEDDDINDDDGFSATKSKQKWNISENYLNGYIRFHQREFVNLPQQCLQQDCIFGLSVKNF